MRATVDLTQAQAAVQAAGDLTVLLAVLAALVPVLRRLVRVALAEVNAAAAARPRAARCLVCDDES